MTFQFPPINYLYLMATGLALTMAVSNRVRAGTPDGRFWLGVLLCFAVWTAGELIANTGASLAWQLAFQRLVYGGACGAVICWLFFALHYSGHGRWLTNRTMALLLAIPVASLLMVMTLEWHTLLYEQAVLVERNGHQVLRVSYGAGFWVLILGFAYPYTVAGCALLLWVSLMRPGVYRWQSALIAVAALFPLVSNMVSLAGVDVAGGFDPTSLYFLISAILITLATGRYRFLSLTPVARDRVFEIINLPVVVCNREGYITDTNPAFSRLVSSPVDTLIGQSLHSVLTGRFSANMLSAERGLMRGRVIDERDGRQFDVNSEPLGKGRRESPGTLVTLQDVTGVQQALDRMTRVVRDGENGTEAGEELVVVANIDHFRRVNDEHGVDFADSLLSRLNRLLAESLRPEDQIVRWRGEEFCIVLRQTRLSDGRTAMERLRRTVEQHTFRDGDIRARITMTFGLVARGGDESLDDAIRRADLLMYVGKQDGRNRVVAGE